MRLILMRHAKSDWSHPSLPDEHRPLNARGEANARALGVWLHANGLTPDEALLSPARRTVDTFLLLKIQAETHYLPKLYNAPASQILDTLSLAQGACVLLLGHNPGIAEAASRLVQTPPDHPRFADYPTAATLVVDFPARSWAEMKEGTGVAHAFVIPRELPAA